MANQLLMRGHATVQEMLTASFGDWPPKGLDINPDALKKEPVKLIVFVNAKLNGQATSTTKEEREISINQNSLIKQKIVHSTLGHEAIHIMQGDTAHRKERSFLQKLAYNMFTDGEQQPLSNRVMEELTTEKKTGGGLCSEFQKVMKKTGDYWGEYKHIQYLRSGIEVQARIHQIIIEGYPRWGKVPATQDEFYAAMKNAGLNLPPEIEKRLENLPANSSAHSFLKCEKGQCHKVSEINEVTASFPEKGKQVLWNKVMPALYADLITMYGDKQGGQKMGFDTKIQADVAKTVKTTLTAKQTTPSLS
ncbi:MAG: hypothetical protein K8R48_07050 [Alphaproteobacteria bacterium]|nr:hypothetical protein [Alphaproteobacteria bacterium]